MFLVNQRFSNGDSHGFERRRRARISDDEKLFTEIGIQIEFRGSGIEEKGYERSSGRLLVEVSPEFFRPSEVDLLIGDATKAKRILGWSSKTPLEELVRVMVAHDLEKIKAGHLLPSGQWSVC